MKRLVLFLILFSIFNLSNNQVKAIENKILFKIGNEIITSIDLKNETKYLIATNLNIKSLNKNQIIEIAKNSLIKEKYKKIELLKYIKEILLEEEAIDNIIRDLYLRINLKDKDEFKKHLNENEVKYSYLINKLSLNVLWNKLIFDKYSSKIIINKDEIKNQILSTQNHVKQFRLSEIVFDINNKNNLDNKFAIIEKNIKEIGFESTAVRFSISSSANQGGKIGWISENSLNKKLIAEINRLNIGEYTKPIIIPGGFIIIKLDNVKKEKRQIDLNKEIEKVIRFKTNEQLDTFSNIFLKKIMKDNQIEKI